MSLTDDVRTALVARLADLGRTVSEDVLDAIVLSGDEVGAVTTASSRVRWEQWDGTSPVNGIDAEAVRRQMNVTGPAYLVFVDDRVVFFQTTVPGGPGAAPLSDLPGVANQHVGTIVQGLAMNQLLDRADGLVNDVIARQDQRAGVTTAPFVNPAIASSQRRRPRSSDSTWA